MDWIFDHPSQHVRYLFRSMIGVYFHGRADVIRAFRFDSALCIAPVTEEELDARALLAIHIAAELIHQRYDLLGAAPSVVHSSETLRSLKIVLTKALEYEDLPEKDSVLHLLHGMIGDLSNAEIVAVKLFEVVRNVSGDLPTTFTRRQRHPSFKLLKEIIYAICRIDKRWYPSLDV